VYCALKLSRSSFSGQLRIKFQNALALLFPVHKHNDSPNDFFPKEYASHPAICNLGKYSSTKLPLPIINKAQHDLYFMVSEHTANKCSV
jgi:hypothetical protein